MAFTKFRFCILAEPLSCLKKPRFASAEAMLRSVIVLLPPSKVPVKAVTVGVTIPIGVKVPRVYISNE